MVVSTSAGFGLVLDRQGGDARALSVEVRDETFEGMGMTVDGFDVAALPGGPHLLQVVRAILLEELHHLQKELLVAAHPLGRGTPG